MAVNTAAAELLAAEDTDEREELTNELL